MASTAAPGRARAYLASIAKVGKLGASLVGKTNTVRELHPW
jgi:hypothetical protein